MKAIDYKTKGTQKWREAEQTDEISGLLAYTVAALAAYTILFFAAAL